MAIVGAALYSVRILGFDLINAALNLSLPLTTFYGVYFKNLAVFAAVCGLFFWLRNFVQISSWSEFAAYSAVLLVLGYAASLFLIFDKIEQLIVTNKIKSKFKR